MSETPRHPIVAAWLIGDTDAGGCISELARDLAAVTRERDELAREMKRHFPISRFNGLDIGQWKDRAEQAEARAEANEKDARRLRQALYFWLPSIAGGPHPAQERAAQDSVLLIGDGLADEKSAHELGWISTVVDAAMEAGRE